MPDRERLGRPNIIRSFPACGGAPLQWAAPVDPAPEPGTAPDLSPDTPDIDEDPNTEA
jgi:hypothetical protein